MVLVARHHAFVIFSCSKAAWNVFVDLADDLCVADTVRMD